MDRFPCAYVTFKFDPKTGKPSYVGTYDREALAKLSAKQAISKSVMIDYWQVNPFNENMFTAYYCNLKTHEDIRVAQIQRVIVR